MQKSNKTLFIHIGLPKTGTSALQVFFARNAKELYKKGVRYPGVNARVGSEEIITSGNGARIARNAFAEHPDDQSGLTLGFLERAMKAGDRNVLISSEYFASWEVERHLKLREYARQLNYDTRIIVYLRDQADIVVTHYFQNLKRKPGYVDINGTGFQQFALEYVASQRYLDFSYLLTALSSVYGKENVRVRTTKWSSLVGGSLILDSLDAIGMQDDEAFDKKISKINPTPSQQEMYVRAIMGIFHPTVKTSDSYLRIVSQVHSSLGETGNKDDNFFIEPMVVEDIRNQFLDVNKSVCDEWFNGGDITDVFDKKIYGEKRAYDNTSMAINSVIAVFSGLLVDLQRRVEMIESSSDHELPDLE